jgi:hypothetical protein
MALPPCLRLADLRDLTDDELRAHIVEQYIDGGVDEFGRGGQRELDKAIGTILVAYESVGDYGCDSSSYFLIERDGQLFEVHGGNDSTRGFEGQWEPTPVTPAYLVSKKWSMSTGGYDERDKHHKHVVRSWLQCRFGTRTDFKLTQSAIASWALGFEHDYTPLDLRYVDDDVLRANVRFAAQLAYSRQTRSNAIDQCRVRGLLPTVEDLRVAGDLASWRGHIDPQTGEPTPQARTLVDLWVGFGKHTVN